MPACPAAFPNPIDGVVCVLCVNVTSEAAACEGSVSSGGEVAWGRTRFLLSMEALLARKVRMSPGQLSRTAWKETLKADCRRRARQARQDTSGQWRKDRMRSQLDDLQAFVRSVAAGGADGTSSLGGSSHTDEFEGDDEWPEVTEEGRVFVFALVVWLIRLIRA
jgi:hypothetical protein